MKPSMELQGHQTFPARKRRVRRWIVVYLGCTVAALLFASTMYVLMDVLKNVPPKPHLLFVWWATRFYLWAALSPVVVRILRRWPLHPISVSSGFLHFGASLVFSLVHLILHLSLAFILTGSPTLPGGSSTILQQAVHNYPLGVLAYWIIIAIDSTTNYYERYDREQLRSSQLQAQLAEAHLRTLQMQLQPHFMFNALNSLSDLVISEPKAALRLIARLGDFLRLTLQNSGAQWVSLRREVDFLDAYLEIERVRFADRLRVVFELDPESLDSEVPNLILQPLVENAVRHGVASHIGPALIRLSAKRRGDILRIEVRDNGPGMPDNVREGLGIGNTRERLQQIYGSRYSFKVDNQVEGGVAAFFELPYWRSDGEGKPTT